MFCLKPTALGQFSWCNVRFNIEALRTVVDLRASELISDLQEDYV
jgi:hypothetical protein